MAGKCSTSAHSAAQTAQPVSPIRPRLVARYQDFSQTSQDIKDVLIILMNRVLMYRFKQIQRWVSEIHKVQREAEALFF